MIGKSRRDFWLVETYKVKPGVPIGTLDIHNALLPTSCADGTRKSLKQSVKCNQNKSMQLKKHDRKNTYNHTWQTAGKNPIAIK
jgi:hypothetical protein